MKSIDLLYENEYVSSMFAYRYKQHAWEYDCKFWIVDNKICTDLEGKHSIGELYEDQVKLIEEYEPIIKQREKENRNWIAFNQCRKRTCMCKQCNKFCNCADCTGKITDCNKIEK
jgi:hypothetical protein